MRNNIVTRFIAAVLILSSFVAGSCAAAADNTVDTKINKQHESIRAWHFVLKPMEIKRALWMVDLAHNAGFNAVVVEITWGLKLDTAPWEAKPGSWSKSQFLEWVRYARKQGMTVIPEIKLLTHQKKLFHKNFPNLMYNAVTYDPDNIEVYKKVFPLLDEVIELIHPTAIHIGHDEVVGWNAWHAKKKLKEGEVPLPASLFLQDILTLHGFLQSRGVETWMWGDMLLSPDEFPNMLSRHLHGSYVGYGKVLRAKIPKDIVICDWHYFDDQSDFPTLDIMQKEGFRVLGSTWKKENTTRNFSRYAAKHDAHGMIATTWFHVVRKEWDVVEYIIKVSGEAFSKDFPDKK